jgi:hypothetical protein
MNLSEKKLLSSARFYGAIVLDQRIKLLKSGGNDKVVDELISLANSRNISIGEAANVVIEEVQAAIQQAHQDHQAALASYDAYMAAHKGELATLRMAASNSQSAINFLTESIAKHPKSQDSRRKLLKEQGLTSEQIEVVIGFSVDEIPRMKQELETAIATLAEANERMKYLLEEAHTQPMGVSHAA